jgi:hypothetical protein
VRPEHVRVQIGEDPVEDARGEMTQFMMMVTGYETSGDESFLHGSVDDQDWVVRCRGMLAVAAGQKLALLVADQDVARF